MNQYPPNLWQNQHQTTPYPNINPFTRSPQPPTSSSAYFPPPPPSSSLQPTYYLPTGNTNPFPHQHQHPQNYPPYPTVHTQPINQFHQPYAPIRPSSSPFQYPPQEPPSPPNVPKTYYSSTIASSPPPPSPYQHPPLPSNNTLTDELERSRTTVRDLQSQLASQGQALKMALAENDGLKAEIARLKTEISMALQEKHSAQTGLSMMMGECENLKIGASITNANLQNIIQEQATVLSQMENMNIGAVGNVYGNRTEREDALETQLAEVFVQFAAAVTQEFQQSSEELKNQIHTSIGSAPAYSEPPPVAGINPQSGVELTIPETAVMAEWKRQKASASPLTSKCIDFLMENVFGLDAVKWFFLKTRAKIETMIRQGVNFQDERFDLLITGNPGTLTQGAARIYGTSLLEYKRCFPGNVYVSADASECFEDYSTGIDVIRNKIMMVVAGGGGIIELTDIHLLVEAAEAATTGKKVLDYILTEMGKEAENGRFAFVLSGHTSVLENHPTLASRFPNRVHIEDFTDEEILLWLEDDIKKKYNGKMSVEGGTRGQYLQVTARRIGQARSSGTFQNADAINQAFARIRERQGERLERERRQGKNPNDFFLTKEDLIGPNPSDVKKHCPAWDELNSMIGLHAVKESLKSMIEMIETNYLRELQGKAPTMRVTLNKVFLGPPGTGKTTVARLYGQILAHFGLLSSSEVVVKSAADFVGDLLGQSEVKTKAILASAVGKVLIIDEAYLLNPPRTHGTPIDIYKVAIIDTLVAEVQSTPGEDRCVLLLGYEEEMRRMFQETNPGLARRFDFENPFIFEHYSESELQQILDLKLKKQGLNATPEAKMVASEIFSRARVRPNFGNGGEVENVMNQAKLRYQARMSKLPPAQRPDEILFLPEDFDPEFARGTTATLNCRKLFEDMIGCDEIVQKLEGYQRIAQNAKRTGCPIHELIPTNFLFKGPPGTGKTMVARKMGKVYYDMGFLATNKVIECSSSDLISVWSNETGATCQKLFEKSLGHVLFIDEAYRLSEGGGRDALNEIVDMLTKTKYFGKLIVILAGYDDDMNRLLAVNPGLSSRFADEMIFRGMTPPHCVDLLAREIESKRVGAQVLRDTHSQSYSQLCGMLAELSGLPLWGNARDIMALAKTMVGNVYNVEQVSPSGPVLTADQALGAVWRLLTERRSRMGGQ